MSKTIAQLLAEADDSELCNGVFLRIVQYHGQGIDASALREEERVVYLVWHVSGIVNNGGFRYLFEESLEGDPYFALTAKAFEAAGCKTAAEAVRTTLAMFPDCQPPTDIQQRLKYYLQRVKQWPTRQDIQFFDADDELRSCLASYIRSHAQAYKHLDGPAPRRRSDKPRRTKQAAPCEEETGPTLADLPRWARVAFAAHCARQVFPLLTQHWPTIPAKHSRAIVHAIKLAEQSASAGRAAQGLKAAATNAVVASGAAMLSNPEFGLVVEAPPENAYSATIASLIARAAAKAAESARDDADDALLEAIDAWHSAVAAANSSEATHLAEQLAEDFFKLYRAAARGKWTDQTKVPAQIWRLL